jgi:hypothetical protein
LQSDYCYEAEQQLKRDIAMSDLGIERYSQRLAAKRIKTEMQPLFDEFSPFSDSKVASETDDGEDEDEDESSSSSDAESQVIERNSNYFCQKESARRFFILLVFLRLALTLHFIKVGSKTNFATILGQRFLNMLTEEPNTLLI